MSNPYGERLGRRGPKGAGLEQIKAVYRRSAARIRRVAAAIIGDREAALDAVQTGFSTAVRRRSSFRGDGPLDAWVWRIVVNEARDERARLLAHDGTGTTGDVSDRGLGASRDGARDEILNTLAELSERQRLVVFLRYYADFDYPMIARALAISEGTVGATLSLAHTRLRELLEEVSS
jgi:RNA polymerase sigma-70 factor (ECF subfamily)